MITQSGPAVRLVHASLTSSSKSLGVEFSLSSIISQSWKPTLLKPVLTVLIPSIKRAFPVFKSWQRTLLTLLIFMWIVLIIETNKASLQINVSPPIFSSLDNDLKAGPSASFILPSPFSKIYFDPISPTTDEDRPQFISRFALEEPPESIPFTPLKIEIVTSRRYRENPKRVDHCDHVLQARMPFPALDTESREQRATIKNLVNEYFKGQRVEAQDLGKICLIGLFDEDIEAGFDYMTTRHGQKASFN